MEWQKRFIRDVYEPHGADGKRLVRRAVLSVARKNGKSAILAALALAHLVGPEAIQNGEIYSAANDRDQAALIFKVAAQIVRADPELSRMLRVVDSTKTIACYGNGSTYKAISAEAGTKHGLNPSLVIFDELAQARNRDLFDVLDTSMGARSEPLMVTISTQSADPEHLLSKLIDDGLSAKDPTTVVHLYAVPDDCEDIFNPKVWKLANPALGSFRSLTDFKSMADRAQRMPGEESKFRNLYLNQRFDEKTPLIARADWFACQGAPEWRDGEPVYLALDLASTTDLAALVMVSADAESDRVRSWFWKPEANLDEHAARDFGSGHRRYHEWRDGGWLRTTPGRSIDPSFIAAKVGELAGRFEIRGLAYDRWRVADFLRHLDAEGIQASKDGEGGGLRVVSWGQGFRDMAPAVDAFERSVIARKLQHDGNPVLTWNVANAMVATDPAGNRKLDKDRATFRIDGAQALAMALGLKTRDAPVPVTEAGVIFL
jgi:phage terminase large subunit-like protein